MEFIRNKVQMTSLRLPVAAEAILKWGGGGMSRAEGQRIEAPRGMGCWEGLSPP